MTQTKALRSRIDESGYKLKFVASKLGLSYQGFLNKLNNNTEFNASELRILKRLLALDASDFERIFFTNDVDLQSTEDDVNGTTNETDTHSD